MRNRSLWERIIAHRLDGTVGSAPYSVKLAQAEGWTAQHTARVIEEYRRFVYLTQVADTQMTPSEPVDRAWHMHLTFTRNYWDEFCAKVLGKPLHHDPCAGDEDMPRYRVQYQQTMALYEQEFGARPPRDIWEPVGIPKEVLVGGAVGVLGAVIMVWRMAGAGPGLPGLGILGMIMMVAGFSYAAHFSPTSWKKGQVSGSVGGCGDGCGGCGG